MSPSQTSLDAFEDLKSQGKIRTQKQTILKAIGIGNWTNKELEIETGLPATTFCERVLTRKEIAEQITFFCYSGTPSNATTQCTTQ